MISTVGLIGLGVIPFIFTVELIGVGVAPFIFTVGLIRVGVIPFISTVGLIGFEFVSPIFTVQGIELQKTLPQKSVRLTYWFTSVPGSSGEAGSVGSGA
jgi:hypothetical protein